MKKNAFFSMLMVALLAFSMSVKAQDIVGKWQTIDDDGVTKKSVVEIKYDAVKKEYTGTILDITDPVKKGNKCTACDASDERYNKPILGMSIIKGMKKTDDNEWDEGNILDPSNGKVYSCQMSIDDKGNLTVTGYMGFSWIGRSQTWKKMD